MKRSLTIILLFLTLVEAFGNVDTLRSTLNLAQPDTNTVINLNKIGWSFKRSNLDSSVFYSEKAHEVSQQIGWLFGEARSLHQLGVFYKSKGEYERSLQFYDRALEIWDEDKNLKGRSITLGNKGVVFRKRGEYLQAIKLYEEALQIAQQLEDTSGIADNYTRLGLTYWNQGVFPKALEYYFQALAIYRKLGNDMRVGLVSGNIGLVYWNQLDYENALKYYQISYESDLKTENKLGAANVLTNMGICYMEKGALGGETNLASEDLNKAIECYMKALEHLEGSGHLLGISNTEGNLGCVYLHVAEKATDQDTAKHYYKLALDYLSKAKEDAFGIGELRKASTWLGNIGVIYLSTGRLEKAEESLLEGLKYSTQIGAMHLQRSQNAKLSDYYEKVGNYEKSLQHYKSYVAYKDSIYSEDKSKEIGKLEAGYEFEKKLEEEKRAEEERHRTEQEAKSRKDNIQYSGILVFVLLLFAVVFMSGKFSMSEKVAEGLIFFTFLLFFEFCLVLLDPYIESLSGGEPLFKLLLNALLAAAIFPAHAFFEETLKKRLLRK